LGGGTEKTWGALSGYVNWPLNCFEKRHTNDGDGMRAERLGNGANWSLPVLPARRNGQTNGNGGSFGSDVVGLSSSNQPPQASPDLGESGYNLHSISHSELLKVMESGALSPDANASSGITISADGAWKAAPGTTFSSALFTMVEPSREDRTIDNGAGDHRHDGFVQGRSDEIAFDQS